MKAIIFGTGKMYQKIKTRLRKDIEIISFIDNDPLKWDCELEGTRIVSPQIIDSLVYDFIFLLSAKQMEMKKQLLELGVLGEKILGIDQIERICQSEPTKYFGELPKGTSTKKILFFSHALTSTGAQNVMYVAVQSLKAKGYEIVVVSKQDGVLRDRILSFGVPVVVMGNPHLDNEEFLALVRWADKIFVNTVWLYYIVDELLQINKSIIWWIHETIGFEHMSRNLIKNIKKSDNLSVYVVSPLVKRRMFSQLGKELDIKELRFGLPMCQASQKGIFHQEKKVFAIIGAMGWIKGQDLFIQAVEQLSENGRAKTEFWIVGRGRLQERDLKQAEQYANIKIIGEVENEKMPDLYSQVDVVVCCSREESMSVVVIEGCMNEKLVIVSDAAGIAEYITNGEDGLIFQSDNVGQLVSKIEWVIANGEGAAKIGHTSKRIYDKYFSMEIFERNLLSVITT